MILWGFIERKVPESSEKIRRTLEIHSSKQTSKSFGEIGVMQPNQKQNPQNCFTLHYILPREIDHTQTIQICQNLKNFKEWNFYIEMGMRTQLLSKTYLWNPTFKFYKVIRFFSLMSFIVETFLKSNLYLKTLFFAIRNTTTDSSLVSFNYSFLVLYVMVQQIQQLSKKSIFRPSLLILILFNQ